MGALVNNRLMQGCLLLLAALIACPPTSFADEAPQNRDCRLRRLASIDLDIGTYVIMPVSLDGNQTRMGLTTAMGISVIFKQDAEQMHLAIAKPPSPSGTMEKVTVDSFSLGSLDIGKVQLMAIGGPQTRNPAVPAYVGWFAMTSLVGMDFELDFAHNKLNLFSTAHCPGKVVYWTDTAASVPYSLDMTGIPVFPMELDGQKVAATVQAGGSNTKLRTDFSKKIYGFDEHSPGIETRTLDSGKTISHYRAMKMTAQGLSVTNADVELVPGSKGCFVSTSAGPQRSAAYADCHGVVPLTLGLDVLRHLRLYFATKEHVLYFTPADAVEPPAGQ